AASVNYHGASPWPPSTLRDNFDLASSMKLHRSSRWYPIETAPLPTAADAFPGLATVLSFFELQARVAQWIRAFASGAKGRRFDPCRGYHSTAFMMRLLISLALGFPLVAGLSASEQRRSRQINRPPVIDSFTSS